MDGDKRSLRQHGGEANITQDLAIYWQEEELASHEKALVHKLEAGLGKQI